MIKLELPCSQQSFEGWGINIAWWANTIGTWPLQHRNAIAGLLFGSDGLQLDIVRFNIGAGDHPNHHHMDTPYFRNAQMQGYQPEPGQWDWNGDAAEREILRLAKQHGAKLFEAFANSAPYWMTLSQCSAGNYEAQPNFDSRFTGAYAQYLAEVILHFREEWGIEFRTIAPFNEPDNAWGYGNAQEGMVVTPQTQGDIILALHDTLAELGLQTGIAANDVTNMDHLYSQCNLYSPEVMGKVAQLNVHAYAGSSRKEVRAFAKTAGKRLWMSEFGCGDSPDAGDIKGALALSRAIILDIEEMLPAAWVYWQPVENIEEREDSWGLIRACYQGVPGHYALGKQYYVFGHFTRHIPSGSQFLHTGDDNMAAALRPDGRLALVAHNSSQDEQTFCVDIKSMFSTDGLETKATMTNADENYAPRSIPINDGVLNISLEPWSIVTVVVGEKTP